MNSILFAPLLLGFIAALSACALSDDDRQADGKPYHHLANGRFRNLPDSPMQTSTLGDFLPFLLGRLRQEFNPVTPPADHMLDAAAVQAGLVRHADQDHLTWLGHAAFLVQLDGVRIITDPYLAKHAGPFNRFGPARYVPAALTPETLPPLDLILVSHNHYDHLDEATIEALPNKDRVTVIVPLQLGPFFTARGYRNVVELDWHQSTILRGVTVTAVPAAHFSRRGAFDKNRSLWAGFVIEGQGKKVFFSGDTGYAPLFREIGRRYGPMDVGLVGIGAYEPPVIMKPVHTTPEEAVEILKDVRAKTGIGMHWGTVVLAEEPQFEAADRFRAAGLAAGFPEQAVVTLKIGESRSF